MARRDLLNTDDRRILFGVPTDRDALARSALVDHHHGVTISRVSDSGSRFRRITLGHLRSKRPPSTLSLLTRAARQSR